MKINYFYPEYEVVRQRQPLHPLPHLRKAVRKRRTFL